VEIRLAFASVIGSKTTVKGEFVRQWKCRSEGEQKTYLRRRPAQGGDY
jgi:hypothetical protein